MTSKETFDSLVERYRRSPEFYFVKFVDANQTGLTGDTLLHAAVVRGAPDDVDVLIQAGAQVNVKGDLGNTPLHHAASRGMVELARKLLHYGADLHIKNEFGQTPLDLASLMKRDELVALLKAQTNRH